VTLDYKGSRLTGIEAVPVRTIGKIQVVPQKGDEAKPILEREKNLCNRLDTNCIIKMTNYILKLENNDNIIKLDVF